MISPDLRDATSFWRACGPLSKLSIPGWRVDFHRGDLDWTHIKNADVIFMQRPFNVHHKAVCDFAKTFNKPIWLDYDDDLFCLPVSNPAYTLYASTENQTSFRQILEMADHVTVTGPDLKEKIRPFTRAKVTVVPNAWDTDDLPFLHKEFKRHKKFLWRGGPTHMEDIDAHQGDLEKIQKSFPDWKWVIIGMPSYKFQQIIPKENILYPQVVADKSQPYLNLIQFYHQLKTLEVDLCLVPLADSAFNRSKSNIAWMEATFAGAACVGPNWPHWDKAGVIHYNHGQLYEAVATSIEHLANRYDESYQTIMNSLTLNKVNKLREQICLELGG